MKLKSLLAYLWKLPVCGIAFFIGMAAGGALLPALRLTAPAMPEGTDANTIALWFLAGSVLLALALSFLAGHLGGSRFRRWMILFALIWVVGAVGMVLESFFFMETGAVSSIESTLFTILNFLLPSLFLAGAVALFFKPADSAKEPKITRPSTGWGWRIAAALLAYPVTYFIFGLLVQPLIMDYYLEGLFELSAPTWGQLIPLQLVRSALFLLVCLPVIFHWRGSRRGLWLALGSAFFLLTAFMAVITAYWFPWQVRLFHGLELLADGLVYTGILVLVFTEKKID